MNIRSLGYVWIESTNPSLWLDFGTNVLGMMVSPAMPDDGVVYLKMDARPYRFAIYQGKKDRLALCGLELQDESDFIFACKSLEENNVQIYRATPKEASERCVKNFIRFDDPSGNTLELYWGADLDYAKFVSPTGIESFETGVNGSMGFGHAVLPVSKLAQTHQFYRDILCCDDTDYMHFKFTDDLDDPGQGLHFMHVNNPRHHSLALYEDVNNPSGCVHLMVEVKTIDEVGYCLDRVQDKSIPIVSTLGRHSNDNMLSFYMASPTGFAIEFGCDGLQMDWNGYTPTVSKLPSLWGHKFTMNELSES